jgi:hypothetical protein
MSVHYVALATGYNCIWITRRPIALSAIGLSREPRKRRPNALQVRLPRRLSWPCVSDLQSIYKAQSWQRAVTLDDSTPQCRLCENRCGVSTSLLHSRHHRQVKLAVKT